jgi:hypothetical protein
MQAMLGTLRQRRDLGAILRDSFSFYRRDWRAFVTIGAATIPFALVSSAATLLIDDQLLSQLAILAIYLIALLPLTIVEGAIIAYVDALDRGTAQTEGQAFSLAVKKAGALFGAVARIAAAVVPLCLVIIGLPIAIFLMIRWLFAPQAVILENTDGLGGLRSSASLTLGEWWPTFGRVAMTGLLVIAANGIMNAILASAPPAVFAVVSAILGAFTWPYFSIALTLIYFDLRLRKTEEVPAA